MHLYFLLYPTGQLFCSNLANVNFKTPNMEMRRRFLWAAELSADPMVYNKLRKNYQALKQYDRAEKAISRRLI
ncbi:MAG: hypothetical protein ACLU30_10375 [Odoribacter splanchnicus]